MQFPSKDPMCKLEKEMVLRFFSPKTIKSYLYYNKELLRFANKDPDFIARQDIVDYLDMLIGLGKSRSTVDVAINALKFYYGAVMKRRFFNFNNAVPRPKKEKKLPVVLSEESIKDMFNKTDSTKQLLMLQILYTAGLRASEVVNLLINDIDYSRKQILVRAGKGRKDRITVLSNAVVKTLDHYLAEYQPLEYLFESFEPGHKMSVRSVQKAVEKASKKVGINNISAHTLRHSFATHMLENGVNLRYIQSLLGHQRLETTQIYTKVTSSKFKDIKVLLDS